MLVVDHEGWIEFYQMVRVAWSMQIVVLIVAKIRNHLQGTITNDISVVLKEIVENGVEKAS